MTPHRLLTTDEIERYRRDGFLAVHGLYDAQTMLQWRDAVAELLAARTDSVHSTESSGVFVWMADVLPPFLKNAMNDNHVVPILKQLIGPQVEFLSVKLVYKDGKITAASPWHQDWYYWFGAEKVSIWIALDDATQANGCLRMIPGSHQQQFNNEKLDTRAFANQISADQLENLDVVDLEVKRGDVVFFSDRAVHCSYPNTSGDARWSFISTYRDATVPDDSAVWQTAMPVDGSGA